METAILVISILGFILTSYAIAKLLEVQKALLNLSKEVVALKRSTETLEKTVAHQGQMIAEQQRRNTLPARSSDPIAAFLQGIPQLQGAKWLPIAIFAAKQITEMVRSSQVRKKASKSRQGMLND